MKYKILVAEDEFIIALDLKHLLNEHDVCIARTGEELIKLYKSFEPDLIITDINLGSSIDGISAVEKILSVSDNEPPVIFISAYSDDFKDRLKFIHNYLFISKPINTANLKSQIEYLMNEKFIPLKF